MSQMINPNNATVDELLRAAMVLGDAASKLDELPEEDYAAQAEKCLDTKVRLVRLAARLMEVTEAAPTAPRSDAAQVITASCAHCKYADVWDATAPCKGCLDPVTQGLKNWEPRNG